MPSCWLPPCLLTVAPLFETVDPSSFDLEPFVFASSSSAFFVLFTDAAATSWVFSSFFSFTFLLPAFLQACASFFETSCSLGFLPWLLSSFLLVGSVLACVLFFLGLASSSFGFSSFCLPSFCLSSWSFFSSFFAGLLLASFFEGSAALSAGFTFALFSSCFLAAAFTSSLHPLLSLGFASCFASCGFASCLSSLFVASVTFFFSFLVFLSFLASFFLLSLPPPTS